MITQISKSLGLFAAAIALGTLTGCQTGTSVSSSGAALRESLTFYASFDGAADADLATGDGKMYSLPNMSQPRTGAPGLPANGAVTLAEGEGRFGDALRFHRKVSDVAFFKASGNVDYRSENWEGTVSFWLRLNPDEDLAPGFCDPIQITPRAWNDAGLWVDFSKDEVPRLFRLGAFADFQVWNPDNRKYDDIPDAERPLVTVTRPPFTRENWTQVAFTFSKFNTGRADGEASLYLDGVLQGTVGGRQQRLTWDLDKTLIMLGISYIGWFDDLAIFNRKLSPAEVMTLYRLENGVRSVL